MHTHQDTKVQTGRISLVSRLESLNEQFSDISKRAERLRLLSEALVLGPNERTH